MIKVKHLRDKCIGCGFCVDLAPVFWEMNFVDGKANLLGAQQQKDIFILDAFDDDKDLLMSSADVCPVKCIRIL